MNQRDHKREFVRDENKKEVIDDIRDMFAQIMRNQEKPRSKNRKGLNRKQKHHRTLTPKERKGRVTILTISLPINHPLKNIMSLKVFLIL